MGMSILTLHASLYLYTNIYVAFIIAHGHTKEVLKQNDIIRVVSTQNYA